MPGIDHPLWEAEEGRLFDFLGSFHSIFDIFKKLITKNIGTVIFEHQQSSQEEGEGDGSELLSCIGLQTPGSLFAPAALRSADVRSAGSAPPNSRASE